MSIDTRDIRASIEKIDNIPTIPVVLQKLLRVIENPRVSMNEISDYILGDPILTSRVLKLVNSPIYGFPGRISSLNQALILMGLNVVRGILLGVSVFEIMEKTILGLWKHSMGCAVAARIICRRVDAREPEEIAVAALLHDIGKVVLNLKFPDEYSRAIVSTVKDDAFIFEAEEREFQINHSSAGAWIAAKWNFPRTLVEAIGYHHKPSLSAVVPLESSIVHVADILTRAVGFGFAGDAFVPEVDSFAWETLGLDKAALVQMVPELQDSLAEAAEMMDFDE